MSDLRSRIIAAIAQADQAWCSDNPLYEDMADAVIAEMRPRLETWAQMCMDSGDMTPAAKRELRNILGSYE